VILGKTNLSEWANFRSSHSTSGWSGRGGQTKNPYVLDRNPCGSSSGTGAAIFGKPLRDWHRHRNGRLGRLSVKCEFAGGHQTTVGLISRAGIIPISHNQDTARSNVPHGDRCGDLACALAGIDARDGRDQSRRRQIVC